MFFVEKSYNVGMILELNKWYVYVVINCNLASFSRWSILFIGHFCPAWTLFFACKYVRNDKINCVAKNK